MTRDDLQAMSLPELRLWSRDKGLALPSYMNKQQAIARIVKKLGVGAAAPPADPDHDDGEEKRGEPAPVVIETGPRVPTGDSVAQTKNAPKPYYWWEDDSTSQNDPKVTIMIPRQAREGRAEDEYEIVGVNGRLMYIPRGKEWTIPQRYYEVLKNAVQITLTMVYDHSREQPVELQAQEVQAIPMVVRL